MYGIQCRAGMSILLFGLLIAFPPQAPSQGPESEPGSLQFGFEQRVRNENWSNIFDYDGAVDDTRRQLRVRSRAWITAPLGSFVDLSLGIDSESNEKRGQPKEFGEVLVEQAYLDFKRLPIKGMTLRIGRQDITRGDGFIFSDATPYDGSRTFYANALVLAWTRGRHRVEAIALSDPTRDRYLPRFHSQSRMLQESNERAAGLYYTARPTPTADVDAYYFLKKEDGSIMATSDPRFRPDLHVHVAGVRAVRRVGTFTASSEVAWQWGRQSGGVPIRAWGGTWALRRLLSKAHNWYASAGYEALSGDDPSTAGRIEGWNPMFARFVKPSELYLYSGMHENGLGYWSNLHALSGETGVDLHRNLRVKGVWNRMTAPRPFHGKPGIFAGGSVRGNNLQARADFRLRDSWKAHVVLERMLPGTFYTHRSAAYFLRLETSFQVRTMVHPKELLRKL